MDEKSNFAGWHKADYGEMSNGAGSDSIRTKTPFEKARIEVESSLNTGEKFQHFIFTTRFDNGRGVEENGVLVLTNQRIIYQGRKLFGAGSRIEWRLDRVNGVSKTKKLLSEQIELHAGGLTVMFVVFGSGADEFVKKTSEELSSISQDSKKLPNPGSSLAEELHKITDFFQKGLLTQEEFQQAKQQILGFATSDLSASSPRNIGATRSLLQDDSQSQDDLPEIVGESFYKNEFDSIRKELGLRLGDEASIQVELVIDPNNPYSDSGMAVAVLVLGKKVGHISEDYALDVFEFLDTREFGGRHSFAGRIFFSPEGYNSVELLEFGK